MMTQIFFRGQTYNSEFEMPETVRQAYQERERKKTGTSSLTTIEDIPAELKGFYERAVVRMKEQPPSSQPMDDRPTIEELYRRSTPENMNYVPSDENLHEPTPPTIEPESSIVVSMLVSGILWTLMIIAVVLLVTRLLW